MRCIRIAERNDLAKVTRPAKFNNLDFQLVSRDGSKYSDCFPLIRIARLDKDIQERMIEIKDCGRLMEFSISQIKFHSI